MPPQVVSGTEVATEPKAADAGVQQGKDEAPTEPKLKFSGRLLAGAMADEREAFRRDFGIASARVGFKASYGFAQAVVEADVAKKDPLRDAYVRLRTDSKRWAFYGGKFKAPFFGRALASTWDLPRIGRGLVEDFLVEEHGLGGRRLGGMVETKLDPLGFEAQLGVFQGLKALDGTRTSEDAAGRVSVSPWQFLEVAASGYAAEFSDGAPRFGAGADATIRAGGLALSAEGLTGKLAVGRFLSALGMATYDFPLTGAWVLQPVLSAEALRLNGTVSGVAHAVGVGTNVLHGDHLKVQLQAERALRPRDEAARWDVGLQLGVRF